LTYVDASVLLRVALRQRDALLEWRRMDRAVSSALIVTESLRSLDRLRVRAKLPDKEVAARRANILALVAPLDIVVLDRAAQPMPTALGTLDAIHLATALLWRETRGEDLVMATHDAALALGAQAHGLTVIGVAGSGNLAVAEASGRVAEPLENAPLCG
jgi:predicted nucleic acid-binding protein